MQVANNRSLDRVVKVGICDVDMCQGEAVAYISLDTLRVDPVNLETRAVPKSVKVCMKHKSEYFRHQEGMLDRINPERKRRAKRGRK